jgi:predicted metal-dependent peptidase
MDLTAEQYITRQHVWLMNNPKYVLWSGVLMMGKTEVVDDVPTACTNGRDVWYGRKFVMSLTEPKQRGLVLHENLHKGLRQLTTWKELFKENAQLANRAADYVINLIIHDSDPQGKDVALPTGGLLDQSFRGMDTAQVFRKLKERAKDDPQQGKGDGESLDSHDWEGANELTDEEQEVLEKEIDRALRQGRELATKLEGDVPRAVTDVLTPKVDWREAMREFVTSFCAGEGISTWRKPARRWVSQDVYLPSQIGEAVGRLVIAVDTSGSIGRELQLFLGGVRDICRTVVPEGIDLLYWDSHVCQHEKYDPDQFDGLLRSTRPKGGGGTMPQCIVDYIKAHKIKADCCVVLTDGMVSGWGNGWPCPVLWAITSDVVAKVGKSVKI